MDKGELKKEKFKDVKYLPPPTMVVLLWPIKASLQLTFCWNKAEDNAKGPIRGKLPVTIVVNWFPFSA